MRSFSTEKKNTRKFLYLKKKKSLLSEPPASSLRITEMENIHYHTFMKLYIHTTELFIGALYKYI